jgi:hypothetical protein
MAGEAAYFGITDTSTTVTKAVNVSDSSGSSYNRSITSASRKSVTTRHEITDNGNTPVGGFVSGMGVVNYAGKTVSLKVVADYEEAQYSSNYEDAQSFESFNSTSEASTGYLAKPPINGSAGGGGGSSARGGYSSSQSVAETYSTNSMVVEYRTGTGSVHSASETFQPGIVELDLCPYTTQFVVVGSVRFTWMGTTYVDFEGILYRGRTGVDPGIASGVMDYVKGIAFMTDYVVSGDPTSLTVSSLWTANRPGTIATVVFTTQIAPLKPGGLVLSVVDMTGTQLVITGAIDGSVSGPHAHGQIDYETGQCEVSFGDYVLDSGLTAAEKLEWWYDANDIRTDGKIWKPWPVDPSTLRYNCVAYAYLPLDAGILGLDPVRLPQDGRVPIFRPGSFAVVGHTGEVGPATVINGQVINCGRPRLSRVRVIDLNGAVINTGYTANLEAGTITVNDITGWTQPVVFEHRVEDMAMVSDVDIGGKISFTRQITHEYPVPGSYLSSALVAGDLRARVSLMFDQVTWGNVWSDVVSGSAATGTFNQVGNPIEVVNSGALDERWAVVFTSTTAFNVMGEHVGVIATGNTSTDCSPINPASGTPYFTIPALGWGLGWATGNVMRFNTIGSYFPVWVARTIQQGPETVPNDSFTLLIRGDVDRP